MNRHRKSIRPLLATIACGAVTVGAFGLAAPATAAPQPLSLSAAAGSMSAAVESYDAGYLWTHFSAEGGYEKIFMGYSPDGLHWQKLNDNKPILQNLGGDLGVRDPHLVRSPDGDKYWILGTDLHAEGGGAGGSGWDQQNASQNIVVWESDDLVTWSEQRIVFAGFDRAGNVWAPEAIWNEATGEYYVYWSARDQSEVNTPDSALRVYLTKTRDFVDFTEPEVWLSLNEQADGEAGPNIIDTTIAEEDGVYYRFSTSDWHTVVDTATSLDGPWTRVIDRGEAAAHGLRSRMEGITAYELPDGRWAVMGDDGGYYGHVTDSLASLQFTQLPAGSGDDQVSFDNRFRHGSVLRLSTAEEQRLLEAYGPEPVEPVEPEDPQQAPIAAWDFDAGTLEDSAGDADLAAFGSARVETDPDRGKALRLDGTAGGYAAFPTGLFDGRDTMTVSFDMKSDLGSGNFFSFAFGQDQNDYYFLRTRGGAVHSAITTDSWRSESGVDGNVTSGSWHHYDVIFDGNAMTVYVDGSLLGQNTQLTAKVSDLGSGLLGYLGKSFYAEDRAFQGWFDNVQVYNRALSADEVIGDDQLIDISLADESVLKIAPIVDGGARTALIPVNRGTDVTSLAPTFTVAEGVTVSPASGEAVDFTNPVEYTVTAPDGGTATWTLSAQVMGSPVLPGFNADPNIAVFGDTYYMYVTSDGFPGWGGNTFYVWKSKDLVNWTRSEEPFLTLDGENGNVPWATGNAWAPTIIERDGKYYFYFSGHNPEYNRKTIGVAVADSPEGPFTAEPEAMILNNESITTGQAIDPAAFQDPETAKYYLMWGNGGGRAVLGELSDDMTSVSNLEAVTGLASFREGVFLNYRDGMYHLTYSIDDTGSENYRVGYATSDSIHGPWTNRGVILQKDLSLGIKGTGHSSIINVPGTDEWYIAYHRFGMPAGDGNHRETTIDRLTFGDDGLMQPVAPTLTSVDPRPLAPVASSDVSTAVTTRSVAGRIVLVTSVTNSGDEPVDVTVTTAFGSKSITALAPGRTVSSAFSTRLASIGAGSVSTAVDGEDTATETAYDAVG